jgi:hypothetical protein
MQRPRPLYLGLLSIVLVLVVIYAVWPAASQRPGPSNQARDGRTPAGRGSADALPGQLDVRLEALRQPPTPPEDPARNPFRFYVKPPPPPPPPRAVPAPPPPSVDPNYVPPPPPIPLKFIGTLEQGGRKIAIFSDGRGLPLWGKEGELILGQFRIVRIGVESVVMEYADGRGRQTIPMRG